MRCVALWCDVVWYECRCATVWMWWCGAVMWCECGVVRCGGCGAV